MVSVAQLAKIGNTPIARSVGQHGHNRPIDVAVVQHLFNNYFKKTNSNRWFGVVGIVDPDSGLINAIIDFQKAVMKMGRPDGRIDPNGKTIAALKSYSPVDFVPTELKPDMSSWNQDPWWFTRIYAEQFQHLKPEESAGIRTLLQYMVNDMDLYDIRWAAYMFATIKVECKHTFLPIEEDQALWSQHTGPHGYAREITVNDEAGHPVTNRYYGRGYVQLTLRENYLKLGQRLGVGRAFEIHPEQVLVPDTSYRIASIGMREGLFSQGETLSKYITGDACNYYDARNIINGQHDAATLIEQYAISFECLLGLSAD